MDEMYSNYIGRKIDHNYTDNTFEMKCDCHLYVMSVDHVTSNSISFFINFDLCILLEFKKHLERNELSICPYSVEGVIQIK